MSPTPFYRRILKNAYSARSERNARYSIRAFATSLDLDSSACSQLLSGKRVPSLKLAEKLIDRLNLDLQERELFLQSIGREKLKQGLKRVNPDLRASAQSKKSEVENPRRDLSVGAFQAIAKWYYYAILQIIKLPDFDESPKWIATRLGIGETDAKHALERLFELQMITRERGKIVRTFESIYSADAHLTSAAHRRRQHDILVKSIEALENDPISKRNHSGITVAIDPSLIPEAKKRISRLLQELSTFLESGGSKEVYEIQLSLFSLQTRSTL